MRGIVFKRRELQNQSAEQQVRLIQAYQNIFQDEFGNLTPDGELVIKDLMRRGNVANSIAMLTDTRTIDVNATFIAEGKRSIVLEVLQILNYDLLKAIEITQEVE